MALGSDKLKSTQKTSEEIEELLNAVEKLMDRTKVMYEQYFLGIQKLPPAQLHKDIERRLRDLAQDQIRNTGLRFRFLTLQQKLGSYNSYWRRVMRQIEQGTYLRDVARVTRKAQRMGEAVPEELLVKMPKRFADKIRRERAQMEEIALRLKQGKSPLATPGEKAEERAAAALSPAPSTTSPPPAARASRPPTHGFAADLDDGEIDSVFASLGGDEPELPAAPTAAPPPAAKPSAASPAARASAPPPTPTAARAASRPPPTPSAARPPAAPSSAPPPPGMNESQARDLYAKYVKAREMVGQSTADLSYDKLMGSLGKQAPAIMKEHGAKGVEFNVVVKGDKVVLKAKPQK